MSPTPTSFTTNPQLELAFDYVRNTQRHIFLTGKAGTGKTTFLHQIKAEATKRMVIVAPTGVAAINAGGMTIHSFFQLPFGPLVPGAGSDPARQKKFNRDKIRLIQSLDLLVIDEISMVRADLLDGIDDVLRRYRDRSRPFGGVQLLMIGDLHQLPPVVKDEEWQLLRSHYATPYFFSSLALREARPVVIELRHIYRQSDATFIDLLNSVRDNRLDAAVLETLNSRYVPDFEPAADAGYITLTAHNAAAQNINTARLAALDAPVQPFKAIVTGDFPAQAYPTDEIFECKPGAQVMFVKNDLSREKRWYNGKIGQVTRMEGQTIYVKCPGDTAEIEVLPVEWQNVKYSLNEETKEVADEIVGSFTQHPLKLAWAITIHKSQGLTFERAIIDAQAAFAHGQVYVALSRCKSFDGIVLRSKIAFSSVKTDATVRDFNDEAASRAPDAADLAQSKREFQQNLLHELVDTQPLRRLFELANRMYLEQEHILQPDARTPFTALDDAAHTGVFSVAEKFRLQLASYFSGAALPEDNGALQGRLKSAGAYFTEKLTALLHGVKALEIITDNKSVEKTARQALENLQKALFVKKAVFAQAQNGFATHAYLRARANAELDFQAGQQIAAAHGAGVSLTAVPRSVQHRELYVKLLRWRDERALELRAEPFHILPTKVLRELVEELPTSPAALKRISGLGAQRIRQFGKELIVMIAAFARDLDVKPDVPELPLVKVDTKEISFQLFKAGKTIDEIAQERGLVRSTIEGHLAYYIANGELDVYAVIDRAAVEEIGAYFQEHGATPAAAVRTHFQEKYSYGEIKMVLASLE